jgi:hypothetical protein
MLASLGINVSIVASTTKVPLPWISTQLWEGAPCSTPAIFSSVKLISRVNATNSVSLDPQSLNIALFVAFEVDRGPGVNRSGLSVI